MTTPLRLSERLQRAALRRAPEAIVAATLAIAAAAHPSPIYAQVRDDLTPRMPALLALTDQQLDSLKGIVGPATPAPDTLPTAKAQAFDSASAQENWPSNGRFPEPASSFRKPSRLYINLTHNIAVWLDRDDNQTNAPMRERTSVPYVVEGSYAERFAGHTPEEVEALQREPTRMLLASTPEFDLASIVAVQGAPGFPKGFPGYMNDPDNARRFERLLDRQEAQARVQEYERQAARSRSGVDRRVDRASGLPGRILGAAADEAINETESLLRRAARGAMEDAVRGTIGKLLGGR